MKPAQGRRIAVVGGGISGLVAAYLLHPDHHLTLFEANDYIGGHTHTLEVKQEGRSYAVDTGFIVFNEPNYPQFNRLLQRLGVASQPTQMGFSVKCGRTGLEYASTPLSSLLAQRRNALRPSFYRMLADILRFNRTAPELLRDPNDATTLGDYLADNGYSKAFVQHHIIPLGSALWSALPDRMYEFPARYFVQFFANHAFLQVRGRTPWRVIKGGSQRYVEALIRPFRERIRVNCPVASVQRLVQEVEVRTQTGESECFDEVILAVHSDQALRLLAEPTPAEHQILGAMRYQANDVALHTDASVLPKRRRAWASWNYYIPPDKGCPATVTYNMNILQSLESRRPFCVSLNRTSDIAPERLIARMTYHHPVYSSASVAAQKQRSLIDGVDRIHYCGAYWGFGFHEDGVVSALEVTRRFGKTL